MNTLIYTASDAKTDALKCASLLYENLEKTFEFDFLVVCQSTPKNPPPSLNYLIDTSASQYAGDLKFSSMLPKGYDTYIYLDSDILYFGPVSLLIPPENKLMTITIENSVTMSDIWHYYPACERADQKLLRQMVGINAGSFAFRDLDFIEKVRNRLTNQSKLRNNCARAQIEQGAFNYSVAKLCGFDITQCYDISPHVVLFAEPGMYTPEKTLYHFCGFTNEMTSKLNKMERFLEQMA